MNKIVLTDFGLYRGQQEIVLAPKRNKNIVLFGGKNGAGKTTLLEAIRLCFYGQYSSSDLGSRSRYEAYLESRIHKNPNALLQPTSASLEIEFQLGDLAGVHVYSVKRSWTRRVAGKLAEYFVIHKDGKVLDEVSEEHWQDFVRDLIPAGISQLFFFDGEKIQQLAEDTSDQRTLAESIKSLLGVDILERLQADLSIFRTKTAKATSAGDSADQLQSVERELVECDQQITEQLSQLTRARSLAADLEVRISHLEERISSLGGNYAKNREKLVERRALLKGSIEKQEQAIRELASGLLPFCLVPALGTALIHSLQREESVAGIRLLRDPLLEARSALLERFGSDHFWSVSELTAANREALQARITEVIEESIRVPADEDYVPIHNLSAEQTRSTIASLAQANACVPILETAAEQLEKDYRELQRIERDLKNVPPDELIKPIFAELSELHRQLAEVNISCLQCGERTRELELRRDERRRTISKIATQLAETETQAESIRRASTIQLALDEFKDALISKRIEQLQMYLRDAFNLLCRKKDALRGALISPRDFSVVLLDAFGRPLPKAQLSAGEKQIYAISVLWALAKTSGRSLPMIIDTPLARLDSDHRRSLARNYFPAASQQTIILSTDTEIDQSFFQELHPRVARSYRLDFKESENATSVESGYFWSEQIEAYKA